MLKLRIIQPTNNLSDARAEFLIFDRLSFMRFPGLRLAERVPASANFTVPFLPLAITKRCKTVNDVAKTVRLAGRRYIDCRHHEEAKKGATDRAVILAALEQQIKKGDKALVGNGRYRRFLATA
jgi:hypothetical protein